LTFYSIEIKRGCLPTPALKSHIGFAIAATSIDGNHYPFIL